MTKLILFKNKISGIEIDFHLHEENLNTILNTWDRTKNYDETNTIFKLSIKNQYIFINNGKFLLSPFSLGVIEMNLIEYDINPYTFWQAEKSLNNGYTNYTSKEEWLEDPYVKHYKRIYKHYKMTNI